MNRADQGKPTQDLDKGRGWLERAEAVLEGLDVREYSPRFAVEFARAAALIGGGYTQLAALARWAAWRDEDLARIAADREAERENDEVVRESNRLGLEQQRLELAATERRAQLLGELDVATLAASGRRAEQAAQEARPHDDEAVRPRSDKDYSQGAFLRLECDLRLDGVAVLSLHKVGSDVHLRIWHAGSEEYAVAVLDRAYRRDVVHALTEFDTSEADRG